jgi:hypothetical protein
LLSLFAVPGIQSVAVVASVWTEAVRQLHLGATSITRLDLHHYQIHDTDLRSLLAATPRLKYLKYHARSDYGWLGSSRRGKQIPGHGIGLEPLYDALHLVSGTLEELHISQDVHEDSCHWGVGIGLGYEPLYRTTAELSNLKRLRTLTIPYVALLGCKPRTYVYDWNAILPFSLRRIVLNDNLHEDVERDDWTDEELMPVFSTLVQWLSVIKRSNQIAEFGLHLAQLDTDFNGPVQQDLTHICEESGVQCSIEKARADRQKSPRVWIPRGRGEVNMIRGRGRGRGA